MRAKTIYDGFIRFEERSAALYLDLFVRFLHDVELSWFWVEMAMEEKQHAGLLQHCQETGVFTAELPDKNQIQRLHALFNELEERVAQLELTVDQAFEIVVELESSEINEIFGRLIGPIKGPDYVLRKKMELSEVNHLKLLQEAASKFHVSPLIQTHLAQVLSHSGS